MSDPKIYADFHNLDDDGRLRLTCRGTLRDLERLAITLCEGQALTLYTDDEDDDGGPRELLADAVVHRDPDRGGWVAAVDWSALRHAEIPGAAEGPGPGAVPRMA